ncbi:ferric siderophore receptor, putative, TonB receptor family [Candidatus Vecturithrix granuli]|uniref:Ferric siderophore receptor, putative, TonB receptor family n=1 Tax=Vecturithrix granuli TaxID=1499967 RepID=A0A081BXZ9_VECG1|nr:ferric siderophore receptor, putative, TonB receptor family [Candidatus Vecturithrix granuli]
MIAKTVLRGIFLTLFACLVPSLDMLEGHDVLAATTLQPNIKRRNLTPLPFFSFSKSLSFQSDWARQTNAPVQKAQQKRQFVPGKIIGRLLPPQSVQKELPRLSRSLDRLKYLPAEMRKKLQTGIVLELDSAYGFHHTFIGQLQHGTQFKGANYYMQGHWESTEGEGGGQREEQRITGQIKVDWDVSKQSKFSLNSSYFQSSAALPQPQYANATHKKSAIELIAGWQWNLETDTDLFLAWTGELANFDDQEKSRFEMNRTGAQLTLKHLWTPKNMLLLDSVGSWEIMYQDDSRIDTCYYYTGTFLNSFAMSDVFAVEAGVKFDYYHSEESSATDYLIAPVFTTRFRLFRNTNLYTTYSPRLLIPDFTDLYIKKLYTVLNPDLHAEKIRHALETGIHQRFGEAVSLNIGLFYQESEAVTLQIDDNRDNLLEYIQPGSARFIGIKTNLQMNFLEQLVQNITYTYTTYKILDWNHVTFSDQFLDEDHLTYQPNHQVQASVYWATPFGLSFDFHGIYISEQYRNGKPQDRIGKRFFLNMTLTQKITEGFQVYVIGRNLTDTNTYDIIPILDSEEITSSRLFVGGIRIRF